jgi:hypothetical protein
MNMVYIPSVLILSEFSYKKRLLANTFTLCGTGAGMCLYPLMSNFLLSKFGLFDTLLILSAVQLNCLICSMLIKSNKDYNGTVMSVNSPNKVVSQQQQQQQQQQQHTANPKHNQTSIAMKANEPFDTESVNSSSVVNFTVKQHWRRFCQTRNLNSKKTKKNLFHLIAEEKRKSKAASKVSLEDGFVITTSNNLLAPNENNIISRKGSGHHAHHHHHHHRSIFERIAHSLRSLTHHNSHLSSNSSSLNEKYHQMINTNDQQMNESQVLAPPVNVKSQQNRSDDAIREQLANPVLDKIPEVSAMPSEPQPPSSLVNPFIKPTDLDIVIQPPAPQSQLDLIQEDDALSLNEDGYCSKIEITPPSSPHTVAKLSSSETANDDFNSVTSKSSRYLSYRNSLVNSIRGNH